MRGLRFNLQGIVDAYVLFAHFHAGKSEAERVAWAAKVEGVRLLANVRLGGISRRLSEEQSAIGALDDDSREHYFALLAKRLGAPGETIAFDYTRSQEIGGVTVSLQTSDSHPLEIHAHVSDPVAAAWASRDQTIAGGSWECDGHDHACAYLMWSPTLIADLEKEGYDLDLSQYSEPTAEERRIADHSYSCDACGHEYEKAEKHLEKIDARTLDHLSRALYTIAYVAQWEHPTLFTPEIVWGVSP